ncbi:MAG: sugar nucleotide-binding protein [Patescibacteria group bacterium]
MKTIAITAPTSLSGSMIYRVLKDNYRLVLICDSKEKLALLKNLYGNDLKHNDVIFDLMDLYQDYVSGFLNQPDGLNISNLVDKIGEVDAFINCATLTNPHIKQDPVKAFFINSGLPHILSQVYGDKLIHIATDCVFDGQIGAPYNEKSIHHPIDAYGLTRSLGEPADHSLVLRVSLVGPEIDSSDSLIEWLKKNKGKTIKGFTNHIWNGLTSRELALICQEIINNRNQYPKTGLFHLFSTSVTKYEMLTKLKEKYNIDITIKPTQSISIDRRLDTVFDLCNKLAIPSFSEMIKDL